MENFKKRLYDNELVEIQQLMELAGYSDKFICDYVLVHFQLLYENGKYDGIKIIKIL